jgi:SOS-response transcriptional repressor LexA
MDGRIAAGKPLVVDDLEVADYIAFPRAMLEAFGVTKPRCVRVGRNERSMFPTIHPDAIVLLDCSDAKRARPRNGRIYAVNVEMGSTLKRVTVAGGIVFLSSDNGDKAEYPMIEIRAEVHDEDTELPRLIVGEAVISVNVLA